MWARVIEVALGCWLAMSPFIFRHAADDRALWVNDLLSATAIILFALLSFWRRLPFAHLASGLVGFWLIAFGFWVGPYPTPAALQNDIMVGLLLLMFAIVPNKASLPPRPWREFKARASDSAPSTES